ncbi:MAG TPA: neutral/alkaline non-lysosomal ceramidase N-terminal domain-containing protein, partial [Armatimonadota bacterium]|nr:neutral/alkaline non-lysosomal ceramidase N-terminal domain-containing protein [Armatimonadota bacterium]
MQIGFGKVDITPRVGVELCGFGPFINRHSIGIRDRLWARAMAVRHGGTTLALVSCDLIAVSEGITRRTRELVRAARGLPDDAVMVHCTHTHSGPCPSPLIGWGDADLPYLEVLPTRLARACCAAMDHLTTAELRHATAPCEGIGLNREYDRDAPPLDKVLRDDWRPAKPELTDTACHVITAHAGDRLLGFLSYFGCHPVTCCQQTRYLHGDYCGVATNLLER